MKCPRKRCAGSVRVTNSYRAGRGRITQRRACDSCTYHGVFTTIEDTSGLTARALAKEIENE